MLIIIPAGSPQPVHEGRPAGEVHEGTHPAHRSLQEKHPHLSL